MISVRTETALAFLGAGLQVRELGQEMLGVIGLIQLGLVGRSHGLAFDALPVDLLEPRVRFDLFGISRTATEARVRILVQ